MLRRLGNGLVDRNGNETAAVGNFVGLAGIGRIDERFHIQRAFDQIAEFSHAPGCVDTGLPALNHHAGVLGCQNTHRDLPFFFLVPGAEG